MSNTVRLIGLWGSLSLVMLQLNTLPCHAQVLDSLVPNLCPRACNLESYGHEYFDSLVLFRFDNAIANKGDSALFLLSANLFGPANCTTGTNNRANCSSLAVQVWMKEYIPVFDGPTVYRTIEDTVGVFAWHGENHNHWHFEDLAQYRLLEVEGESGVGDTLIVNSKTGFCLVDDQQEAHDPASCGCGPIQGTDTDSIYYITTMCGLLPPAMKQGISVGRFDLYSMHQAGQEMDVTEIPNGVYWLESVVDPDNLLVETSNSDNLARIKVQIISNQDSYEPNDSLAGVLAMPLKPPGLGSSNLVACGFPFVIPSLNIHQTIEGEFHDQFDPDEDWFRFRISSTGDSSHYVRIEFEQDVGDLRLELRNSSDSLLVTADSNVNDREEIKLLNRSAGWYYVRVVPNLKPNERPNLTQYHIMYDYSLTIVAPPGTCGDLTGDGVVSAADVTALVAHCNQTSSPPCVSLGDVDGTCGINCANGGDITYLAAYVFSSGPPPDCTCGP